MTAQLRSLIIIILLLLLLFFMLYMTASLSAILDFGRIEILYNTEQVLTLHLSSMMKKIYIIVCNEEML